MYIHPYLEYLGGEVGQTKRDAQILRLGSGYIAAWSWVCFSSEARPGPKGGGEDRLGGRDTSGAVARNVVVVGAATLATLRGGGTGNMEGEVPMYVRSRYIPT